MNDVATAAGVGRATVYGHFTSRAELVDAALSDVLRRGNDVLAALDLDGDVVTAFASLVSASPIGKSPPCTPCSKRQPRRSRRSGCLPRKRQES